MTHASGHGQQEDLKLMMSLVAVSPQPIHGIFTCDGRMGFGPFGRDPVIMFKCWTMERSRSTRGKVTQKKEDIKVRYVVWTDGQGDLGSQILKEREAMAQTDY